MESELRVPSQQSTKSKLKDSPVFLEPPPRTSPRLQIDNEDTTQRQQQQQAETPRSKKASDLYARRLSFMSFMTFMTGKSAKSAAAAAAAAEQRSPNTGHFFASRRGSATETPPPALSSPHSPAVPDRTNTGSPESEDNVGALPAFGVSDRAYLASLVSLFSTTGHGDHPDTNSSHSPLSSALTALTAPSIEDTNLGPYEYDIHSSAVYAYSKEKRLYVGLPGIVHPPPEALLEFELETLPRLERDLHELSGHFGQRGVRFTYELRMSGPASLTGADMVTLAPTVWVLYRSYSSAAGLLPSCQRELQRAAAQLPYLQGRPLEVQEGGGRIELAGDRRLVDATQPASADDQIQLSGGGALSVHTQACCDDDRASVCGALCSVAIEEDDKRQTQSLCRVGGLLLVNGKYILGVTTAHAMLDSSTIFKDSFDNASEPRSLSGKAVDRDAITAEAGGVARWHDVTRDAAVDFLGVSMNSRGEVAINRSKPENATDFALLRLRQSPGEIRNQYTPPNAEKPIPITSSASASAASLDEGPVYILCGGKDQVLDGQLVWGSACFVVRKRNFHLRRIQTSRPLSASAAGAWVVRGEVLYGVIIAVYEDEPFALMMTAERLFSSILGSAFSIRSVELWDGVLPEAYRRHEEEQQKAKSKLTAVLSSSSSSSKDRGIKVDVRPLSNGSSHGSTSRRGSKQGGAGSFKDTARLNTVKEGIETENEAGPSSSSVSRVGTTAANKINEEKPIESPKSYGLPHIEASDGLSIDEGVTSAGTDHSCVTASEGKTSMTTTLTTGITKKRTCPPPGLLHARTESQTSNITMSGAVQTPLGEEKDPLVEHLEDVDIEDWHIRDWIPGDTDADGNKYTKTTNLAGHFDLKTGPPVRSAVLLQVAEVSNIITTTASRDGRDRDQDQEQGEGEQGAEAGRGDDVSTQSWQLKNALDESVGGESSSMGGPSLLSPPPPERSSQDSRGGDGVPPRVSLSDSTATAAATTTTTTNKRLFFLKRRDSQKTGRGSLDSETATSVVTTSSRDVSHKKSSFLGRFARKKAAAAAEKRGKK